MHAVEINITEYEHDQVFSALSTYLHEPLLKPAQAFCPVACLEV